MKKTSINLKSDPNVLPIRRLPSELEKKLKTYCIRYEQQTMSSLAVGHLYEEMDQKILQKKIEEYRALAESREANLSEKTSRRGFFSGKRYSDYLSIDPQSNLKWFDNIVKKIADENNAPLLEWDPDMLAENPLKALTAWYEGYQRVKKMTGGTRKRLVSFEKWTAFQDTSIYVLSLFIPCGFSDHYNPLKITRLIDAVLWDTLGAYVRLRQMYSKLVYLRNQGAKPDENTETGDSYNRPTLQWKILSKDISQELLDIFQVHIAENDFSIRKTDLIYLVDCLSSFLNESEVASFFMPFICTKLFYQVFFSKQGDVAREDHFGFEDYVENCISNYETLERLGNVHQRKVDDEILEMEAIKHPVIRFMQDVASLSYRLSMIEQNMREYDVMDQINTNWLTLYYYGRYRIFNRPEICSEYCGMRLPLLMRDLFWNGERTEPNSYWLYRMLCYSDRIAFRHHHMYKLEKKVDFSKIEEDVKDDAWRIELAGRLFNKEKWDATGLMIVDQEKYSCQIDHVNEAIKAVHDRKIFEKEGYNFSKILVKIMCAAYVVHPIEGLVRDYFDNLAFPENQSLLITDY